MLIMLILLTFKMNEARYCTNATVLTVGHIRLERMTS